MNPRLKMRSALAGAVVALTFALTWSLAKVPTLEDKVGEQGKQNIELRSSLSDLQGKVDANAKALEQANARLVALGKAPEPVPADPQPPAQPAGLTASQLLAVRGVVTEILASTDTKLSPAAINQIARTAGTLAQQNLQVGLPAVVRAALDAYCVDDRCVKTGAQGPKGDPGERGEKGDGPTDEQLLQAATSALATYCGAESQPCKGDDGIGVKEITCRDSDLMWVFEMTDGTVQYVRGPCRVTEEGARK